MSRRLWVALLAPLLSGSTGCAGLAQLSAPDSSKEYEPPSSWTSGVTFRLADPGIDYPSVKYTTRVEFAGDGRNWDVSNRDLFRLPNGVVRTPWYRLHEGEDSLVLKFTVEYPDSVRTVAEYRMAVRRDEFYTVFATVFKRDSDLLGGAPFGRHRVSFPLNPRSAAQPGDSLWVHYYTTPRDCFGCPT